MTPALALVVAIAAAVPPPVAVPAPVTAPDTVDAIVARAMAERSIPAVSVAVLRDGRLLKRAAYGRANVESDVPATPATRFAYASMTKAVAATAVLRLVEAGRLGLDDRVADLLPGLPAAWAPVTVRQLLGHTSGLPDVIISPNTGGWRAGTREAALPILADMPLQFEAGAAWAYNQTNSMLLAMLLERLDGRTIEAWVAEEARARLGLDSFVFGDARTLVPGRASSYTRWDLTGGRPEVVPLRPLWIEYPPFLHTAAGLNGTAEDLARFVAAVASGELLCDVARSEMWRAVTLADGETFRFGGTAGQGLGWGVDDDPAHPFVHMGGAASGLFRHYVRDGLTVVVLTNCQGAEPERIVADIAATYLGG